MLRTPRRKRGVKRNFAVFFNPRPYEPRNTFRVDFAVHIRFRFCRTTAVRRPGPAWDEPGPAWYCLGPIGQHSHRCPRVIRNRKNSVDLREPFPSIQQPHNRSKKHRHFNAILMHILWEIRCNSPVGSAHK